MHDWTDIWWVRLLAIVAGSGLAAAAAWRARALSASGAWSAFAMGAGFMAFGSPVWIGTLLVFFISSSFWSKWKKRHRQKQAAEANYAKSGRRDAGQVWANGGLGLAICAANAIWPAEGWLYAFAGVMAAVNADTWATEIGALSRSAPRSLLSGKVVKAGTSGGVTLLGSAAAAGGALLIGVSMTVLPGGTGYPVMVLIAAAAIGGLFGAFADSFLGATVQAMYACPACGAETERTTHCGIPTRKTRGFGFMTNDAVNMVSSAFAGLVAIGIGMLLS
ncbi:DUF92 domain-containing protein [Paenibacillus xanthanilyticus]|uniref:DUF92 domain-containing protein n=1 Tax=Paenibacillus xanthanilyticus TaxID=1783531 RepID=A0ABV8KA48_9BACL